MARNRRNELTEYERNLLHDIHSMFRALRESYDKLGDKSGIHEHLIEFDGFDGNDPCESRFVSRVSGLNSHGTRMPLYQQMVQKWKYNVGGKTDLTREDILLITEVGPL